MSPLTWRGVRLRPIPSDSRKECDNCAMLKEPVELTIGLGGELTLPLGLLAEAGLNPGERVIAHSDGDGRMVLRRSFEAAESLFRTGTL